MRQSVILIKDINTYEGDIPSGYDLVEYDYGQSPEENSLVLYGFDEVGSFGFKRPKHAFVSLELDDPKCSDDSETDGKDILEFTD